MKRKRYTEVMPSVSPRTDRGMFSRIFLAPCDAKEPCFPPNESLHRIWGGVHGGIRRVGAGTG